MSLRMTEEEFARLQARQKAGTGRSAASIVKRSGSTRVEVPAYDLQALGQLGLLNAQSAVPGSPMIPTLRHGLKQLARARAGEPGVRVGYESIEQALFLLWLESSAPFAFQCTTAVPMGGYRPAGSGGQIRGEGSKSGFPDLIMDLPKGKWHGLRIEMKKFDRTASPSEDQLAWLKLLASNGYRTFVCRGHQAAVSVCAQYLGIKGIPCELPEWAVIDYNAAA